MATNFSLCKGSYVLNQFPSNVMFGMNGFYVSAIGAIQGHHGPLVFLAHLSTTSVRRLSFVVNNFFKHLLLPNRLANLDQTWQECSLGGPLQKLFTEFDSLKNSGCHGNEIEFFKQFFKNRLHRNGWSNFKIIS